MTAGAFTRIAIFSAMTVTIVIAARSTGASGASPLSQAKVSGLAPSTTVAFVAGDTSRYVARTATAKPNQYVHLSYTITEARPGNRTVTYTINKYVRAPHTDVVRCKQTCSGYLTASIWSKPQHARYLGSGSVTVRVWKP
jgi:hypothetical protein